MMRQVFRPGTVRFAVSGLLALAVGFSSVVFSPIAQVAVAADSCAAGSNPIVCENSKPGTPQSVWDVSGNGDPSIQGFAANISVNVGGTIQFKVDTNASAYTIAIYRLGYYGGDGARLVANISPSAKLPQIQPACISDPNTLLYDCGNWGVSASWVVPTTAVSGVYVAHLTRTDTGGESLIVFVVRDDSSHSDIYYKTSDTTWEAYNTYGGSDLYPGAEGRAYMVSYNRPYNTRGTKPDGDDFLFSDEYPMIRFLERNGYDVSYTTSVDADRYGSLIKNHKVFMSVGHDEYWSPGERANVTAARDAGVNLAFMSGNEIFWKIKWANSFDGSNTPYRTIVCYKETMTNSPPMDPSGTWTGTWRDPRYSPPSDGGNPENALTGTSWIAQAADFPMQVTAAQGKNRLWRNTSVATLAPGTIATLAPHTVGYEFDTDVDNGYRPAGLIDQASTTVDSTAALLDFGSTVGPKTVTQNMTMYRAASGALVFGAGTIQFAWGLDSGHDQDTPQSPPDPRMQQMMINLLADMGVQPQTLMSGLVPAAQSADTTPPTSEITSPVAGTTIPNGTSITVTGTAQDSGGGVVAGVEVSTDGGATWHPASGLTNWSYTYVTSGLGNTTVMSRAIDDSGNIQQPATTTAFNSTCPCSLFGATTPKTVATNDTRAVSLGMKFSSSVSGWVTGVRFYKSAQNTGTHTGSLWTTSGTLLAKATFTNETASGWQQVAFAQPVPITAGTEYLVSYYTPTGYYSSDDYAFLNKPYIAPPLSAAAAATGSDDPNGVFTYGADAFPTTRSPNQSNYYVDVSFSDTKPADTTPPQVTSMTPLGGASSVSTTVNPTVTFSEPVQAGTINISLSDGSTNVPGSVSYDSATMTATFATASALNGNTNYTLTINAAKDLAGNALAAPVSSSFRTAVPPPPAGVCPCSIWNDTMSPTVANLADPKSAELGVRFTTDVDGTITGVKFYKGSANTGTHTGSLWSSSGTLLATATFTNESTSGWQTVTFGSPVAVTAGATYVASYHTSSGSYSADRNYFANGGIDSPPLHALPAGSAGANGVYAYGATTTFPSTGTTNNYWVDVVFVPSADTTPPMVVSTQPSAATTGWQVSGPIIAKFSEPVQPGTISLTVTPSGGQAIQGSLTYTASSNTITFTPSTPLLAATTYSVVVSGVKDVAGNVIAAPYSWSFTTSGLAACPCSIWSSSATPQTVDSGDSKAVELGVKFTPDANGSITGVRFYKSAANTGTHTGSLWSSTGTRLATATFSNETASGWQTATFANPVSVTAGTTYVASDFAPNGHYSDTPAYFATSSFDNSPLHALANGVAGANGVYNYGGAGFPANGYNATNYWVDVVFDSRDLTPPSVVSMSPVGGAGSVVVTSAVSATFSEAVQPSSVVVSVSDGEGGSVAGSVSYDSGSFVVTFAPSAALAPATTYTVNVSGALDLAGNPMSPVSWSFTTAAATPPSGQCPCSLWPDSATPATPSANDSSGVEVGLKFVPSTDGVVTGVRFYKGAGNTGTHTGSLWSVDGTLLASVTFSNESTVGWQTAVFSTPVQVKAGTTYVVSYYAPNGHYAADRNYFKLGPYTRGPLTAPQSDTVGGNGVYLYGTGGFPINSPFGGANYWVDVVFQPDNT